MILTRSSAKEILDLCNELQSRALMLADVVQKTVLEDETVQGIATTTKSKSWNPEIENIRQQLIGKIKFITQLLYDPIEYLKELNQGLPLDLGTTRTIVRFGIPSAVPLDNPITISELSSKVSIEATTLFRIIAYATTYGIFKLQISEESPENSLICDTRFYTALAQGTYAEIVE
ncbi:hypothetical protein NHQ30_007458 [Ciborinia camelliae]|nr:hypothetical protein NHQ30_007458 [Ciborinia camelliae]